MDGYWARVEEFGKDDSPYRAGFAQTIVVAETDEEAERDYREHIDYFYNRCLHVYPGFADAPGYRTIKTLKANVTSQMTQAAVGDVTKMSWDQLVNDGYVIAGSPDTVVEKMKDLISTLRVGNIFCLLHVGDMPQDKCMRSTRLFAEEVMPKLRNMWPEHADDDRFWIHPIDHTPRSGVSSIGAV
jgi:alkanesulfonate monooxygenase SsuD/methylene tetrahydromethanopterin reductase-like flavin-dependent oxidoreductase (luciferase family)